MARRLRLPRLRRRAAGEEPADERTAAATEAAEAEPNPSEAPTRQTAAAGSPAGDAATTEGGKEAPRAEPAPEPEAGDRPPEASRWQRARRSLAVAAVLLLVAGGGLLLGYALFDEPDQRVSLPAVAPTVVIEEEPEAEAAEQIGFPAFATRNTTRVGGVDPISDAAGVALASYPAFGAVGGPRLAVLAPAQSWQAALAASSLAARPLGAPILLGSRGEIPGFTAEALAGLSPTGVKSADGTQLVAIGGVAVPDGLETVRASGGNPAELAKQIDRRRAELSGDDKPEHILVVPSEEPALAMPAAAWAANSGDPIVFAAGDEVPQPTLDVLERYPKAAVYVLGPESAISTKAVQELRDTAGRAVRVGTDDPVANAIEFARFVDGSFGWNINDPGHGFTIANAERPADAAAAAPLAAGGKPGPLLLIDSATELPRELRNFLLDTKPGFSEDPTRAVYNHIWLIGDTGAISLGVQAQIDALTELERVRRGSGVPDFFPDPTAPESEPPTRSR